MNELFVIADIHGQLEMLNNLLKKWNLDSQQLVFTGDYIDRGPDSYGVVLLAKNLQSQYGAKAIGGNHELAFLEWLDDPEDNWFVKWRTDESVVNDNTEAQESTSICYFSNGGDKTVNSFYDGNYAYKYIPSKMASYIKKGFTEEVEFIRSLPDYFEWGKYVCVHAGVNLAYVDWKKSTQDEMRRIRKPFHAMKNDTGKVFIFGHHPTKHFHKNKSHEIWISPCRTKIGIDGGAAFGGLLHGLVVKEDSFYVHSVDANGFVTQ